MISQRVNTGCYTSSALLAIFIVKTEAEITVVCDSEQNKKADVLTLKHL